MAIFVTIYNDEENHRVQLTPKPFVIGRSSSCDLKITDELISGKHATLQLSQEKRAVVKDLDSTNGTLVNGIKIQESYISIDDELIVGGTVIKVDPEAMSEKERQLHTREGSGGKTQMKFMNLHGEKESSEKRGIQAMKKHRLKEQESNQEDKALKETEKPADSSSIKFDFDETDDDHLAPPSESENQEQGEETPSFEEFKPSTSGYDPLSEMDDADPTKLSDVRPSPNKDEEQPEEKSASKKEKESLQERARKLSKSSDYSPEKNNSNISQIDAEQSTGNTQMIQIEKKSNSSNSKSGTKKKKKSTKKKKQKKEKKLSPLEKIIDAIKSLIPGG